MGTWKCMAACGGSLLSVSGHTSKATVQSLSIGVWNRYNCWTAHILSGSNFLHVQLFIVITCSISFLCIPFQLLIHWSGFQDNTTLERKTSGNLPRDEVTGTPSKSHKEESRRYNSSRETLAQKYAAIREQQVGHPNSIPPSREKDTSTASVSLLDSGHSQNQSSGTSGISSSGLSSTWTSMKTGFQNFKANVGAKKFLPLRQLQEATSFHTRVSSSESLDEIFQRLKQKPSRDQNGNRGYKDSDHGEDIWVLWIKDLNTLGSEFCEAIKCTDCENKSGPLKKKNFNRGSPDNCQGDSDTIHKSYIRVLIGHRREGQHS